MEKPSLPNRVSSSILDIDSSEFEFIRNYLSRAEEGDPDAVVRSPSPRAAPQAGLKHRLSRSQLSAESVLALSALVAPDLEDKSKENAEDKSTGKKRRKIGWTNTEDLVIMAAVRRIGTQWGRIAGHLPSRTGDAVRNRWHRLQRSHPLAADTEECRSAIDGLLIETGIDLAADLSLPPQPAAVPASPVREVWDEASSSWVDLAAPGGGLSPPATPPALQVVRGSDHGRSSWTAEEDALIEAGVRRFGCKWREIAALDGLHNRSDSSVRNRWMRLCKEKQLERQRATPTPARPDTPHSLSRHPSDLMEVAESLGLGTMDATEVRSLRPAGGFLFAPRPIPAPSPSTHLHISEMRLPPQVASALPLGLEEPQLVVNLDSFYEAVSGVLSEAAQENCASAQEAKEGESSPELMATGGTEAAARGGQEGETAGWVPLGERLSRHKAGADAAEDGDVGGAAAAGRNAEPRLGRPTGGNHSAPSFLKLTSAVLTGVSAITLGVGAKALAAGRRK